jgi:hypothetical protein
MILEIVCEKIERNDSESLLHSQLVLQVFIESGMG